LSSSRLERTRVLGARGKGVKTRDPHHQALAGLAAFADEGRFGWGELLIVTALADELQLSPTPVREALARLAGEGMVEHRPGRGYFAPSPSAGDIADLYEIHRRLAHWAIEACSWDCAAVVLNDAPLTQRLEAVFAGLVSAAGSSILTRTFRRTTAQLRMLRAWEARTSPLTRLQVDRLEAVLAANDPVALRDEVDAYHRDRVGVAEMVVAEARRAAESISPI